MNVTDTDYEHCNAVEGTRAVMTKPRIIDIKTGRAQPTPPEALEQALMDSLNPLLFAGDLVNEISWSKSTGERFDACLRKYFLHKYGSWGGWNKGGSEKSRRVYVLKQLTSRAGWIGSSIHTAVTRALGRDRAGELVDAVAEVDETVTQMRRDLALSKRKTYWQIKKGFGLVEHEYGFVSSEKKYFDAAFEQADVGIRALLRSTTYARAAMSPRVFAAEEMDGFLLRSTKIYVEPDVAFTRPEDGMLELVDWKTGKAKAADSEQLVIYAAYAEKKWRMPPDQVVGRLVYVGGGEIEEPSFPVERQDLNTFEKTTLAQIGRMRVLHGQSEEAFPKTTNTKACEWCAFRGECWPKGQVS